jgi:hypothetical protein
MGPEWGNLNLPAMNVVEIGREHFRDLAHPKLEFGYSLWLWDYN